MGTSKLETSGAAARTAVTPMVQVPADRTALNLFPDMTASEHPSPARCEGRYAVQSGRRPNAVMSRSWGSSGISPAGRSAMAPTLR